MNDAFMVAYTCDVIREDTRVCEKDSGHIWSHENTLPGDKLDEAYAIAVDACLNKNEFTHTTHNKGRFFRTYFEMF